MFENQLDCIICHEIIDENFIETKEYFNCECQNKVFHTSCFIQFLKSPTCNNCPTCRKQFSTIQIQIPIGTNREISRFIGFLNFITAVIFAISGFKNGKITGWFGIFFAFKSALYITSDIVSFHFAMKFVFIVCQTAWFITEFNDLETIQSFMLGIMIGIDFGIR